MKNIVYCLSFLLMLLLLGCEDPASQDGWNIISDSGIVVARGDVITFDRKNFYGFPGDGAFEFGFEEGDSVRFEVKYSEVFNITNGRGETSNFSCVLVSMTNYR